MHKRFFSGKPFRSERVNEFLKLLKSAEKYFDLIPSLFLTNLSEKKLVLGISEILGLLVNTWTANYEDSCNHRDDLPLPVQMLLCQK